MSEQDTTDTATVDDATQIDDTSTETQTQDTETTDTGLGDAGKKALDAMKAERNAAKAEARQKAAELEQLRAELALKDKPAEEQALEAAKAEARAEATTAANARILKADLRAAATGKLADPADAALFIDLTQFTVSDDGETDSDALIDAISDLLERKPHLAAQKQTRFDGAADQGAKGKDAKPGQISATSLDSMSPAQINQARREGRLDKVLGKI